VRDSVVTSGSGSETEYQLVTGNVVFDRERVDTYRVAVGCRDLGGSPQSSSVDVRVVVGDLNDNAPAFPVASYAAEVTENGEVGAEVVRVAATDADAGWNGLGNVEHFLVTVIYFCHIF